MATNNADNFSNPLGVANGGTGLSTLTAFVPLCGGTTSTGSFQQPSSGFSVSGNILKSGGPAAIPSWGSGSATFVKISSQTASSSSAIVFDDTVITSTYSSYLLTYSSLVGSTSASLLMTISTNNGSTYLSTGYFGGYFQYLYNTGGETNVHANNELLIIGSPTFSSSTSISGTLFMNIPQSAPFSVWGRGVITASGTGYRNVGTNSGTTTINNIKIAPSAGTIASGTLTLYGIHT